jgi:hypothetical protein
MSEEKTANTGKKKSNTTVKESSTVKRNVPITMDNSVDEVVELSRDDGVTLFFDPNSFLELPSDVVDMLGFYSAQSYFQAKNAAKSKEQEKGKRVAYQDLQVLDPLSNSPVHRTRIRKRRGFHQTWKRPDEVESAKEMGYKVVRKPNEKKGEEEPGYESGEVLEILDGEGKVELVAMEIDQDIYDKHRDMIKMKSKYKKEGAIENLQELAERTSAEVGMKGAVKVRDMSKDEGGWKDVAE